MPWAWLSGVWGKIAAAAAIAGAILLAVLKIRQGGRDAEKVERAAADQKVRDRVDAVKPPAAGETEGRLNKGEF